MEFCHGIDVLTRGLAGFEADIAALSAASTRDAMAAIGRHVAAAQRLQVLATAHFARLGAFRADGAPGTAAWLRAQGLSGRSARTVADAARATSVHTLRDAVERGVVGVEHAALLAPLSDRVAAGQVDAAELTGLIESAASSTPDTFRQQVRAVEIRVTGDHGAWRRARSRVDEFTTDDGMGVLRAELDPERHLIVRNALDALVLEGWRAATRDQSKPSTLELPKLRADALVEMARRSLHGSGVPSGAGNGGRGTPEVIVLVDDETLRTGIERADGICRFSDGTALSGDAARRIACDAAIIPVVLGGTGEVLDVGRKRRLATPAQWVALRVRTETCEVHGCSTRADWCRAHHIRWWECGGETNLENLALVCERHHHLVHEGGWALERTDGTTYTRRPDGTYAGPAPPREAAV